MGVPHNDFQFLRPISGGLWPVIVVLFENLALLDNISELFYYWPSHVHLLANHYVILVLAVVCVPQLAIIIDLKLEELVAKTTLVADLLGGDTSTYNVKRGDGGRTHVLVKPKRMVEEREGNGSASVRTSPQEKMGR